MKIYKIKVRIRSSQITPWQSDTIFGSLCWAMVQKEGRNSLEGFLKEYKTGNYPFVVSDGFPDDLLPKPMAGNVFPYNESLKKNEALEVSRKVKNAKKTNFTSLDEFNSIINNKQVDLAPKEKLNIETGVMHNQLSRTTNTTNEGSLYEQLEIFWASHISIYFAVEDDWKQQIIDLFEILAVKGFGKRISVGKGYFSIEDITLFKDLSIPDQSFANSFVTLSNYIPKADDPVLGQYKTFVKYGKLGQEYAFSGNPFKKPLLMIKPGAVFWANKPRYAYGRLIENVSHQFSDVVQCGCTLAIPAYIEKPEEISRK